VAGPREGFHEGLANIYSDAAEAISAAGRGIKRMANGQNVDQQPVEHVGICGKGVIWEVTFE